VRPYAARELEVSRGTVCTCPFCKQQAAVTVRVGRVIWLLSHLLAGPTQSLREVKKSIPGSKDLSTVHAWDIELLMAKARHTAAAAGKALSRSKLEQ
jgi:hypothetical protein